MKNLKIVSLLLAFSLILSIMFIPALGAADVEGLVKNAIGEHRTFATDEQETEIKAVESLNNAVVAKSYSEAPWSTILTGSPALLTSAICTKQTSVRTLTLEFLRGKTLSASSAVSASLSEKIATLKSRNDEVMLNYNLDSVSISDSAAKYSALEDELTGIYALYNSIRNSLAGEGASLLVDGAAFSGISSAQAENMFSERITNFFKDINSLMLAGKDTWEAAYENLLCGENKITMGLILGSEGAAALANAATMQQIFDYIESSDILKTIAGYQTSLYSDNFATSNTALYGMIKDVLDDILSLSGVLPVKNALESAGWTSEKIVAALKIANDAADVNFYSRAINLNMILGRYMGVYKGSALQSPVIVNCVTAPTDVYDICVAKSVYKASVINVLDTAVYMPDGSASAVTTSDDEGKLKFTAAESDVAEGYSLVCYRDGAEKNVYNYIDKESLNVIFDDTVHVESVVIKEGHEIEIYENKSEKLTAIISPLNAEDKRVIWTVGNPEIASVDQFGNVTGLRKGETTVTVTTLDGGFTATIKVIVKRRSSAQGGGGGAATPTPTPTVVPVPTVKPDGASYFVDLEGHWAYNDLDILIKKGIVSGYGDGSRYFMPDAPITRAEFATVMCKMMNLPITKGGVNYSDTINHWSRDYVATVTKYGYMIGVAEDLFAPDLIIPREQVIAVILRVIAFQYNVMHAGDEITNDANDILNLVKEYFGYEYKDLSAEIKDIHSGSDWARAYVEMAYKSGYVKGYEDKTMRPVINATRAEAMIMSMRAILDDMGM